MPPVTNRSSLRSELYKPASGGFVDVDIEKDGKVSLRTLVRMFSKLNVQGIYIDIYILCYI